MTSTQQPALNADIYPLSETAVTVRFGTEISPVLNKQARALAKRIEERPFRGFIECTAAFASVTLFYNLSTVHQTYSDREASPYLFVREYIKSLLTGLNIEEEQERRIEVPVCYGGKFGPDLSFVAKHNGLAEQDVIDLHTAGEYPVYMIGFAPGFAYMGGLSKRIHTPRRTSPRTGIPAGSVGIGGGQTGIYPLSTPGGWQVIGCTPVRLFTPEQEEPTLLAPGDILKFVPISSKEYEQYQGGVQ